MRELVLVRHASTDLNERDRFQGSADVGLSARGRDEAHRLRERLSGTSNGPDSIWTSDLRRARETARLAFPGVPRREDRRLRELDFGAFEGATYEENRTRHGGVFLDWIEEPDRVTPPGGESLKEFRSRIRSWIDGVKKERSPLAVSHGGTIRMIVSVLTGVAFDRLRRVPVPPASSVRLRCARGAWKPEPLSGGGTIAELENLRRTVEDDRR